MKRNSLFLILLFFACAHSAPVCFAADFNKNYTEAYADTAWVKLGRGLCNIVFSPAEIIYRTWDMSRKERYPIAAAGGFLQGLAYFPVRLVVGVYEVVTFPFPIPDDYRNIMEPEFPIPTLGRYPER